MLASQEFSPKRIDLALRGEAAALSIVVDGEQIEILGIHPPSPISAPRSSRRDLMLRVAGDWAAARDGPVVVLGDFNATPWSAAYRALRWRGGLVDSLSGSGYQGSWPAGWGPFAIPIDHVLHTPDLGTTGRRTGPPLGSAHRPVVVSVGMAA